MSLGHPSHQCAQGWGLALDGVRISCSLACGPGKYPGERAHPQDTEGKLRHRVRSTTMGSAELVALGHRWNHEGA